MKEQIEHQLIRRLKLTGWILFVCAITTLIYRYIPQDSDELDAFEEETALELKKDPSLNPFFVSGIFALVGSSCFFISWRKGISSPENKNDQ